MIPWVTFDREAALADGALMCNYLPLLRECLPEVAADVEEDLASLVAQTEKGAALPAVIALFYNPSIVSITMLFVNKLWVRFALWSPTQGAANEYWQELARNL